MELEPIAHMVEKQDGNIVLTFIVGEQKFPFLLTPDIASSLIDDLEEVFAS